MIPPKGDFRSQISDLKFFRVEHEKRGSHDEIPFSKYD